MTNYHHWLLLELYHQMTQVFELIFPYLECFILQSYLKWNLIGLYVISSYNGYKTIYDDFNIMWILTVKYDTPFKNKNKSWEKPDRNRVYLFKVSFGNMTRDASFLKIMLISGLTVMIVLVVYTKINLQQPIVTCNRIHNFGIW